MGDNSTTDCRETGYEGSKLMDLAQDRIQWLALMLPVLDLWGLLPKGLV
jgi:hypothetical protein